MNNKIKKKTKEEILNFKVFYYFYYSNNNKNMKK